MNYAAAIEFLYSLRLFGTKLGLENTLALAARCGDPHRGLRFIHVAGTNGKGSTCAMLENIFRRAGSRVGLFTSPHLVSFTERMQVNRECIAEAEVERLTGLMMDRLGGTKPERWPFRPTFFEFVTVMALLHFSEARCDLVVWETGLGGRLDATNIVTPLVSVITNIQYDHQQWLGATLAEIAREKAGIIKPGIPVVTGVEDPAALEVIQSAARQCGVPCTVAPPLPPGFSVSLAGPHQRKNAAVALAATRIVAGTFPVPETTILDGLATTWWPGRLQLVRTPGGPVLLDGAHNPDGARALAEALRREYAGQEITLVLGLFQDKEWSLMCDLLVPACQTVYLPPLRSDRAASPAITAQYCRDRFPGARVCTPESTRAAIEAATRPGVRPTLTVIAGSLHFVGEAMEILHLASGARSERELNEWDAARKK